MRRGRMDGRSMRICAANHKNDTSSPVRSTASTTMFPILSRTKLPSNATQNKSVVAKHDDHTIWNETTPGRKSAPSDLLKTSLWGVVGDVTTSPICFPFARQIPAFPIAFAQKDNCHLHITCPHPHTSMQTNPRLLHSFKHVLLDPSHDSHRTICPMLFDGMMPAGNPTDGKETVAGRGDTSRSEVRQGGSGRPRRGCFVGRRGGEDTSIPL